MKAQIPSTLAVFFQEYTFENLDVTRDWELIVERTLAWGNRGELRWMFDRYGRERVADWVKRRGAFRLPRRQLAAWKAILEIPEAEIISAPRGIWQY